MLRPPPRHPLFPYTTLFRSRHNAGFWLVERFAAASSIPLRKDPKYQALVGRIEANAAKRRSEEHTSELQSRFDLVCRLLLEKKKLEIRRWLVPHAGVLKMRP